MAGQNHHFGRLPQRKYSYAIERYRTDSAFMVFGCCLADHNFIADEYSIADGLLPWIARHEWQEMDLMNTRTYSVGLIRSQRVHRHKPRTKEVRWFVTLDTKQSLERFGSDYQK